SIGSRTRSAGVFRKLVRLALRLYFYRYRSLVWDTGEHGTGRQPLCIVPCSGGRTIGRWNGPACQATAKSQKSDQEPVPCPSWLLPFQVRRQKKGLQGSSRYTSSCFPRFSFRDRNSR